MRIDILTLFPEMFDGFLNTSIIKRARELGKVKINVHNFRDYSLDKHGRVDDYPYGGGAGMVLMCEPIFRAIEDIRTDESLVIMLSPGGKVFKQSLAIDLSHEKHIILLCGHYEGFDERIKTVVDMQLSIGDYVLTGGELPAMVLIDSVSRLIDGVLGGDESAEIETFKDNLLEYPQYTKPREFMGISVPEVLISGDHAKVDKWRREQAEKLTRERRPDLIDKK